MDRHINVSFGGFTSRRFASEIESYVEILLNRIAPIFDDVEAEQQRKADEVLASSACEHDDYDMAMEIAHEDSIGKTLTFMELRSVFMATGVSGLFHLFEKQLLKHLNHELCGLLVEEITDWRNARSVLEKLKFKSVNQQLFENTEIQHALDDSDLRELQLVTNSVKHSPGRSYNKLKAMKAAVVKETRLKYDWTVGQSSILGVSVTIFPDDVERYRDSLLRFWRVEGTFAAHLSEFNK